MEPNERIKVLVSGAGDFIVNSNIPAKRYCRTATEMDKMAKVYLSEKNYDNAFHLWMKTVILLVEKLPKHPGYSSLLAKEKQDIKKLREFSLVNAEKLKKNLRLKYEKEYNEYCKEEERKKELEKEKEKEKERVREAEKQKELERQRTLKAQADSLANGVHKLDITKTGEGAVPLEKTLGYLPTLNNVDLASIQPSAPPVMTQTPSAPPFSPTEPPPPYTADIHPAETHPSNISSPSAATSNYIPEIDRSSKPATTIQAVPDINRSTKPEPMVRMTSVDGARKMLVPRDVSTKFLQVVAPNTRQNLETCGILAGKLARSCFRLTHILIPKQSATPDSCTTESEEELFEAQDKYDLITLGWIHTHPSQTSFLSSVDLHTQCSYQQMLPEAIAIVCAPKYQQTGVYRLTPNYGLNFVTRCNQTGFHPHPKEPPLFEETPLVSFDDNASIKIVDLR